MKLKISGTGSRIGYTVLSPDDVEFFQDNINISDDEELSEFCDDDAIWDEIKFKHNSNGAHLDSIAVLIDDVPVSFEDLKTESTEIPKLSNISGDGLIFTLIKDYKGVWFETELVEGADLNKLYFETTIFHDVELITKVLYNGKELRNELEEFNLPLYNTFANLSYD